MPSPATPPAEFIPSQANDLDPAPLKSTVTACTRLPEASSTLTLAPPALRAESCRVGRTYPWLKKLPLTWLLASSFLIRFASFLVTTPSTGQPCACSRDSTL